MKQRDEYIVDEKVHNLRAVNLVCYATFYGKRKDKLDTLVFKDVDSKEILIWKHIESEATQDYRYLKEKILQRYITMRPKLETSKDLKKIVSRLTLTTEKNFTQKLDGWYENIKIF